MSGKQIIWYILAVFLAGTGILVYIQYSTARNVNSLITANNRLINELKILRDLSDLEQDITIITRQVRGFVETGDSSYMLGMHDALLKTRSAEGLLMASRYDSATAARIQGIDSLVRKKIALFGDILDGSRHYGRKAAADAINANLRDWLSYEIESRIAEMTEARRRRLTLITEAQQKSGQKALDFSYILIALVVLAAATVFWYIIHIIRRLVESEKKVRETVRIKENFLANMSHEIRTPMNAILGFTQLLGQKELDGDARNYIKAIQDSGENLLFIVNDILDISKIEAGMMHMEKAPFSIRGLVNSLEVMMLPRAEAKGIRFFVDIDNAVPDVLEGDPVRLTQILSNLIGNALKFTQKGFISVKITSPIFNGGTVQLNMDVSDTGIGIEPHKLQHVFGRFQQADETITRQYGGTGLGLSIVKDLVELQDGTITVESILGVGTVFHITIPYTVSPQTAPESGGPAESPTPPAFSFRARILIAEDNEFNKSLLSHLFRNWQLSFDIADNGLEAIEKLKSNRYDLILMDIQMPVMDGYAATRKIRNELKSDIPIIAMTAHALPGEREKCLSYGMDDYIAKPVKQKQLSQLISRFAPFTRPDGGMATEQTVEHAAFTYIDLSYMKDISAGNTKYELDVTQKFLSAVPVAIQELQYALRQGDTDRIKRLAHNLRTTISIMGLNQLLDPLLDKLESGDDDLRECGAIIEQIADLCIKAIGEASQFKDSLT